MCSPKQMRLRLPLAVAAATLLSAPAAAQAADLNVLTDPGTDAPAVRTQVPSAPAQVIARIPELGLTTVRVPDAQAAAVTRRLRADERVASASPVARFSYRALVPDDPALTQAEPEPGTDEGTTLQWWAFKMGLPEAWELARGDGIRVGVIDSGIDGDHRELQGKISSAVDVQRFRTSARTDVVGHGTHVSSLACGATGNGVGIAGAGYKCKVVALKTDLSDLSVAAGLVRAVRRKTQVVNMSFGASGRKQVPAIIRRAIAFAARNDVLMVAAAADDPTTQQGDPANVLQPTGTGPKLDRGTGLVVTAATVDDERASFAGRGTQISLAGYGAYRSSPGREGGPLGILAAFPDNGTSIDRGTSSSAPCGCRVNYKGDPGYAYLAGTSMAAPQVAGVAALVRSANRKLSAKQVIRILKETARRPSGRYSNELGWGIVDAAAAVRAALAR